MQRKFLYIVGGGHSGSTLLDMILGTAEEVFSVGEASFFDNYFYRTTDRKLFSHDCSCGRAFPECPFWSRVRARFSRDPHVVRRPGFAASLKAMVSLVLPYGMPLLRLGIGDDREIFNAVNAELDESGSPNTRYILDSSKDPRRLLHLLQTFGVENVHVIHLVRDVRGYVNSYTSPRKARVRSIGLAPQRSPLVALRWLAVNLYSTWFLRRHRINHVRVSYDLFCERSEDYVAYLNSRFDIEVPPDFMTRLGGETRHNINGNPMRFRRVDRIRRDTSWAEELRPMTLRILSLLFYPFNLALVQRDSLHR